MTVAAAQKPVPGGVSLSFDRELEDLPAEFRWREWMGRIEATIFASASPVSRENLASLVGQGTSVDLLIEDIVAELQSRPYELVQIGGGWMFRTKTRFADAIKAAADLGERSLGLSEMEMAVLCAVAYHQPIDRASLADIFGKDVSRDLLARLRHENFSRTVQRRPGPGRRTRLSPHQNSSQCSIYIRCVTCLNWSWIDHQKLRKSQFEGREYER